MDTRQKSGSMVINKLKNRARYVTQIESGRKKI